MTVPAGIASGHRWKCVAVAALLAGAAGSNVPFMTKANTSATKPQRTPAPNPVRIEITTDWNEETAAATVVWTCVATNRSATSTVDSAGWTALGPTSSVISDGSVWMSHPGMVSRIQHDAFLFRGVEDGYAMPYKEWRSGLPGEHRSEGVWSDGLRWQIRNLPPGGSAYLRFRAADYIYCGAE